MMKLVGEMSSVFPPDRLMEILPPDQLFQDTLIQSRRGIYVIGLSSSHFIYLSISME